MVRVPVNQRSSFVSSSNTRSSFIRSSTGADQSWPTGKGSDIGAPRCRHVRPATLGRFAGGLAGAEGRGEDGAASGFVSLSRSAVAAPDKESGGAAACGRKRGRTVAQGATSATLARGDQCKPLRASVTRHPGARPPRPRQRTPQCSLLRTTTVCRTRSTGLTRGGSTGTMRLLQDRRQRPTRCHF